MRLKLFVLALAALFVAGLAIAQAADPKASPAKKEYMPTLTISTNAEFHSLESTARMGDTTSLVISFDNDVWPADVTAEDVRAEFTFDSQVGYTDVKVVVTGKNVEPLTGAVRLKTLNPQAKARLTFVQGAAMNGNMRMPLRGGPANFRFGKVGPRMRQTLRASLSYRVDPN